MNHTKIQSPKAFLVFGSSLIKLSTKFHRCIKSVGDCTILPLPLGWLVCLQAKANVCNVRWSERAFFTNLFFEAVAVEAVSGVVRVLKKLFVKSTKVSSLHCRHRVSANGLALGEGGDFHHKC